MASYCEALPSHLISNHVSVSSVSLNNAACHWKPGDTQRRITRVGVTPGFKAPFILFRPLISKGPNLVFQTILAGRDPANASFHLLSPSLSPSGASENYSAVPPPRQPDPEGVPRQG